MDNILHRNGAYLWLRGQADTSVFLQLPEEDVEKKERVVGSRNYIPLLQGMLGVVSGGIEFGETAERALWREIIEELGVVPRGNMTNGLPSLSVGQLRGEREVSFDVVGYVMPVDEWLRVQLLQRTPLVEVSDGAMPQFLEERCLLVRPFVAKVARQLMVSGHLQRL